MHSSHQTCHNPNTSLPRVGGASLDPQPKAGVEGSGRKQELVRGASNWFFIRTWTLFSGACVRSPFLLGGNFYKFIHVILIWCSDDDGEEKFKKKNGRVLLDAEGFVRLPQG